MLKASRAPGLRPPVRASTSHSVTYQEDLSPCTYFDRDPATVYSKYLLAVGWLDADKPYRQGSISPGLRAKLGELLVNPWNPFATLGVHECNFCGRRGGPSGWRTLFIPGERGVFAAPELIHHYIDHHHYRPPDEFCEALESCPPMRSDEYVARLQARLGPLFERMHTSVQATAEIERAVAAGELLPEAVERVFAKYRHLVDPE